MPEIKKYTVTKPYINPECSLGESPSWEKSRNSLRFVDILNKRVYFLDLAKGPSSLWYHEVPAVVAVTADIDGNDDEFVFGGKYGYGIMHRETGEWRWVKKMHTDEERRDDGGGLPGVGRCLEERVRSNDGAVDKMGRFYVGTMNDALVVGKARTKEGMLFRLDPDLTLHRIMTNLTIPNGTTWTSDSQFIYFTDSPTRTITKYPYDLSTGAISIDQGRVFWTCPTPKDGSFGGPDGHCQDEEGCLWIAGFGLGKVFRVNPQGETIAEVLLPTACVTCCVLVGTELWVTTATEREPERRPWSVKYQGAVFRVDVGVRGQALNKFRMTAKA